MEEKAKQSFLKSIEDIEQEYGTSVQNGLSTETVAKNEARFGKNKMDEGKRKSPLIMFLEQFNF